MLVLLLLIPVVLLGVCAAAACVLGGRCERAREDQRPGRAYRLQAEPAPRPATDPALTAHG